MPAVRPARRVSRNLWCEHHSSGRGSPASRLLSLCSRPLEDPRLHVRASGGSPMPGSLKLTIASLNASRGSKIRPCSGIGISAALASVSLVGCFYVCHRTDESVTEGTDGFVRGPRDSVLTVGHSRPCRGICPCLSCCLLEWHAAVKAILQALCSCLLLEVFPVWGWLWRPTCNPSTGDVEVGS